MRGDAFPHPVVDAMGRTSDSHALDAISRLDGHLTTCDSALVTRHQPVLINTTCRIVCAQIDFNLRRIGGTCNDHNHRLGIGTAVPIINHHLKALFPLLAFTQCLHCRAAVIQRIGPLAVLVDFKFSVLALAIFNGPLVSVRCIHIRHRQLTLRCQH